MKIITSILYEPLGIVTKRYISDKGTISMAFPCPSTQGMFEICCINGGLFDDVELFLSKEDAERRIKNLLDGSFKFGR